MIEEASALLRSWLDRYHLTAEEALWGALLLGMLCATIHLLTMLTTRWGNRRITGKALIFSLLVHVSCTMGLVATHPAIRQRPPSQPVEEPIEVKLEPSFVERVETPQPDEHGDAPRWDRLMPPSESQVTRFDRQPEEAEPLVDPDRQSSPELNPQPQAPDLAARPEDRPEMPQLAQAPAPELKREAETPLDVEAPTPEAREEARLPAATGGRELTPRAPEIETGVERHDIPGTVDRPAPTLDPTRQLASLPSEYDDPTQDLVREPVETGEQLREGPAPTRSVADEPGAPQSEPQRNGTPGPRIASRLSPARSASAAADSPVERRSIEPEQAAGSPNSRDSIVARTGPVIDIPQTGLEPTLVRPDLDSLRPRRSGVAPTYRLRNLQQRHETARRLGGTGESERAVEMSLRWLAQHQSDDGRWDADLYGAGQQFDEDRVNGQYAGKEADAGLTALSILAFLGAGYTHEEGPYALQVDKALRWLVENQTADGYLGAQATHYERNYCHAMATYALAEAYGMQSDPQSDTYLAEPLAKAVAYIIDNQNPTDGGWRYVKGQSGDMSMFGWQCMALKSAEIAGQPIPQSVRQRMIQFLNARSLGENKGLAGYRAGMPPTPTMTAEALFCKQMLGLDRDNPASTEAVNYLLLAKPNRSEVNMYYWYYGTLAMYQYGGEPWQQWNEALRDLLIADQVKTGADAGSWDPTCRWGRYGGRVYSTALCTLCLEVYYRFLPLYRASGDPGGEPDPANRPAAE